MRVIHWTCQAVILFLVCGVSLAEEFGSPDPLFLDDTVLEVEIEAPMPTLLSDRPFEEELPGKFRYTNEVGETVVLDLKIRTRGRFRRQQDVCQFPPMRLNFRTSQTKNTLFHKQDKLKLVTHCQGSAKYEQALLREYAVYRIFNVLTDASFRPRLLRVTYIDSDGKRRNLERYGFVIEHKDRLGKRLDMQQGEVPRTSVQSIPSDYMNLTSVFQYLIGNTDFSPIRGAADEFCCHNTILFGREGQPPFLSIPYDFDQSGMVDAPHAGPNPRFRLRDVRERLYRGRCANNAQLNATLQHFRDKQGEIIAAIEGIEPLSKGTRRTMLSYIDRFYSVLESERRIESEFVKKCI